MAQAPGVQRGDQRRLVDQRTPRGIDQDRSRPQRRNPLRRQKRASS